MSRDSLNENLDFCIPSHFWTPCTRRNESCLLILLVQQCQRERRNPVLSNTLQQEGAVTVHALLHCEAKLSQSLTRLDANLEHRQIVCGSRGQAVGGRQTSAAHLRRYS